MISAAVRGRLKFQRGQKETLRREVPGSARRGQGGGGGGGQLQRMFGQAEYNGSDEEQKRDLSCCVASNKCRKLVLLQ